MVEALSVTSEELLDRFEDKLINRLDGFEEDLREETTEETYTDEQH